VLVELNLYGKRTLRNQSLSIVLEKRVFDLKLKSVDLIA
jgi:hypothetical protein